MKKIILILVVLALIIFIIGCTEEKPSFSKYNLNLPQPLVQYLAARQCSNAQCEFQEDSTTCPADCLKAELSADQWTQVNGPYGGWITDLEKVGATLWTATSFTYGLGGNGIFEVTNKGLEWKALGGTNKSVSDVAVDPSDTKNIAFIADAPFITWDGGKTWQRIELKADSYTSVAMSKANSSLIFVGAILNGKGLIFVSLDDGKNWTKASFLPETEWSIKSVWPSPDEAKNFITALAPHPTNENILFVGTNSALFKSENKGQSWKRIDSTFHRSDVKGIAINPQTPNEVYVRVGVFEELTCMGVFGMKDRKNAAKIEKSKCAGVYKSTDSGETWQQLDAYYADPSEGGVFIDDNNPDIAYAIFSRKILKTEDGGKTWEKFFWTHDEPFIPNSGLERLAVGENSDEVFIAGKQGLFQSEDAGKHWHERDNGFVGSEVVDIIKARDGTLYAGTYTLGMFKSTDGGMSWTFASYNLENPYIMLIAAHPTDAKTIFVTTNAGIYISTDGALTWQLVAKDFFVGESGILPDIAHFHGIAFDPQNPKRIYIGGGGDQYTPKGAGMSITEDGGKTWKEANIGFETDVHVSKIIVDKNNPAVVYATTQGPTNFMEKTGTGYGVFKSTDYGDTWKKINSGLETVETNTIALDPNDSDIIYLGTDDDGIYKSSDGGILWKKLPISQLPKNYGVGDIVVDPRNSNVVYAATVDYFRLVTARGFVGDHGIYKSSDGGTSWQPFNEGLNHAGAFALELDKEKNILYVGTRGGGIYRRKI
ncbi:hypothetical protein HYU06_00220 [Candidatus Woesearchaeota archaeon]|nr:hypothetical protein [Candidatus Woesearchaeota archaeon]